MSARAPGSSGSSRFGVWGLGFRVSDMGFRVWGLGFRVSEMGFRVWGLEGLGVGRLGGVGFGGLVLSPIPLPTGASCCYSLSL